MPDERVATPACVRVCLPFRAEPSARVGAVRLAGSPRPLACVCFSPFRAEPSARVRAVRLAVACALRRPLSPPGMLSACAVRKRSPAVSFLPNVLSSYLYLFPSSERLRNTRLRVAVCLSLGV